ncbi:hypothetical protein AVEN_15693-1 [Araneus ventricosus]|uniref:NrS-1 polymerase-like helicase domain-containing protein n=1 Tax=Araneus ventricosus TaxID=182803 RepID=A0A4Y2JR39_ARAVE|nr:hypothetical protein AVEN_15693-1 [Araneus ventricosus]
MSATNKAGYEYYEKSNNCEIYAEIFDGEQIYAKKNFIEYYAKNERDEPYYAKIRNSEYYAIDKYRDEVLIKIGDTEYYAKKDNYAEFYPKQRSGKEILAKKDGIQYYVKDSFNNEVYPKNQYGNEYKISRTHFAKLYNGEIFYPKNSKGDPIYDQIKNKEVYHLDSNQEPIFGKNICGDEVYAKDESLTEYYPLVNGKPFYARKKSSYFKYAKNEKGEIIYPTINNNQIYISEVSVSSFHALENDNFQGFVNYAQNNQKEIYPAITTNNGQQIDRIVNNSYAKNLSTGEYYYPLDSNNNEYVTNDESSPNEFKYAVTSYNVQIYAKDSNGNEYYAKKNGKEYFAKDLTTNNEFYPKDNSGNEFYFSLFNNDSVFAKVGNFFQMYAKKDGFEFYPTLRNGKKLYAKHNFDQYYCKDFITRKELYAQDESNNFYFAKNKFDEEIYAIEANGDEYYFNEKRLAKTTFGDLKYAKKVNGEILKTSIQIPPIPKISYKIDLNGNETYEEDIVGKQICKLDTNKYPIYAKLHSGEEIYPLNEDKKPYFLRWRDFDIYAKDQYGTEIYFDGDDSSVFAKYNNFPFYAKRFVKQAYYPKNSNCDEFINGDYTLNGLATYPRDKMGKSIYPQDASQNEYYIYDISNRVFLFGTNYFVNKNFSTTHEPFYAKDFNKNEIYPPNYQIIQSSMNEGLYAIDKNKYVIYPKNELNEEIYIWSEKGSYELISSYKVNKYATDKYPRFQPGNEEEYFIEMPLNNKYLEISGQSVYPVDEYANEYIPNGMNIIFELGYPITIDNFIIIPNENNKPKYFSNETIEGVTGNGKSKFFEMITKVFCTYSQSIRNVNLQSGKGISAQPEIASSLFRKRIIVIEELSGKIDENLIKELTGDSQTSFRNLYEQNLGGRPTAKLIASTNSTPICTATEAFRARIITFPFNSTFVDFRDSLKTSEQVEHDRYKLERGDFIVDESFLGFFCLIYIHLFKNISFEDGYLHLRPEPLNMREFKEYYLSMTSLYKQFKQYADVQSLTGELTTVGDLLSAIRQFLVETKRVGTVKDEEIVIKFDEEYGHLKKMKTHESIFEMSALDISDEENDEDEEEIPKKKKKASSIVYYENIFIRNLKKK